MTAKEMLAFVRVDKALIKVHPGELRIKEAFHEEAVIVSIPAWASESFQTLFQEFNHYRFEVTRLQDELWTLKESMAYDKISDEIEEKDFEDEKDDTLIRKNIDHDRPGHSV